QSSVEYSLKCANDTSKKFTREWKIRPLLSNTFNTSKDYWNTFCLLNDSIVLTSNPKTVAPKIYNMSECKMVYKTTIAKFFILSDNKTGVVVLTSVDPPDSYFVNEMFEIQNGFNSLEKEGVKKLVLDFSGNGGGSVELAFFIVYLLFPETDPSFNLDMVVT
ncbi:650_t:CDS:2, partial [Rhizophagus irregularis]